MKQKKYPIAMEIAGPTALFSRPDTGDSPVSYPAPTPSAVRGIFESVLWGPDVRIIPTAVEICAPIQYHSYATNYGGPLRASKSIRKKPWSGIRGRRHRVMPIRKYLIAV